MDILKTFISQFTKEFPYEEIQKINKKYFLIDSKTKKFTNKLDFEDLRSSGLYLGEEKARKFNASINMLNILKNKTDKTIKLNEKASWLFICGRDVFADSILERNNAYGTVLVLNKFDEVIGLAKKDKKDKNLFKNFYDIGHLLRRESKKKR